MALGVRMRSDRKSTITSMVKRGNMGGSVSSNPNKFKRKGSINSDEFKEKDRTDNIKSRDVKLRNNMDEGYSRPSNVRERVDSDRKTFSERNVRRRPIDSDRKTFSERNVRRKPTSSNGLGFHENNLRTVKKFHNRDHDKDTRGRFDRNSSKDSRRDFDSRNQNLRRRVDSRREISNQEEDDGKNESENQNPKPKFLRSPSRVLLKTGKKVRVNRRELEKGSVVKIARKKKKKGIKLDPCDESNKRIDDIPLPIEDPEKKAEMSKNAKFRSIIPTTSILSFVEDNLLGRRRLNELTNAGFNAKISCPLDDIPFSTSNERDRIEDPVFRNKLEFFAAAKVSSSFPPLVLPEIAFAGRSNVGKSSLLNSLTRQWGVARTSDKPGLTQTINFFRLASKLSLVDLPGYGFAYAKEEVKDSWEELVKEYVSTRVGLERVCLLVDTKWGMKPRDHELVDLMERSQTPYQIVLTKTDIVFPIDVARRAMEIQESLKKHKSVINPVMMVSSKTGGGIRNLRSVLAKLSRFVKP